MTYVARSDNRHLWLHGLVGFPHDVNVAGGLVSGLAWGDEIAIMTGIVYGPLEVTVRVLPGPPDTLEDGWEDITEVSVRAEDPELGVQVSDDGRPGITLGGEASPALGEEWHRLRVHARGRDIDYDLVADEPNEHYLLVFWPEPPSPPRLASARSRFGSEAAQWVQRPASEGPGAYVSDEPRPVVRTSGRSRPIVMRIVVQAREGSDAPALTREQLAEGERAIEAYVDQQAARAEQWRLRTPEQKAADREREREHRASRERHLRAVAARSTTRRRPVGPDAHGSAGWSDQDRRDPET